MAIGVWTVAINVVSYLRKTHGVACTTLMPRETLTRRRSKHVSIHVAGFVDALLTCLMYVRKRFDDDDDDRNVYVSDGGNRSYGRRWKRASDGMYN